jgi:ATP-binding cassette subfamily B protein
VTATSRRPDAFRLRSAIPGRERWEVPAIADRPRLAEALAHVLKRRYGVFHAEANPVTAGVLVLFAPGEVASIDTLIREALDEARTIDITPIEVKTVRGSAAEPPKKKAGTLLRILRLALPSKRALAGPVGLSLAAHTVHTAQAISFLGVVQAVIGDVPKLARRFGATTQAGGVGWMAALAFVLAGADAFLQQTRKRAWARVANDSRHRLRARLLPRIQHQDAAYFDRTGTPKLFTT